MNIVLRPYTQDDYDFVWNLHIKENADYIQRHQGVGTDIARTWFDKNIANQQGTIVEQDNQPIGCYFLEETPEMIKLGRFFLLEELQGKGLGSRLLSDLMKDLLLLGKPVSIMVWADNPVMKFWLKKGFVPVSTTDYQLTNLVYKGATT